MSMSDPRHAKSFADAADATAKAAHPLDGLAERLSATPAVEPSPRRDLEHLVSMLAKRNIQTDDRLTNALEGLARWSDRPTTPRTNAPTEADLPIEPAVSTETGPAYERSGTEERMAALARSLVEPPVEQRPTLAPAAAQAPARTPTSANVQPVASLRAALAQIAARQKDLDDAAPPTPPASAVEPAVVNELRREIDRLKSAIVDLPTRSDVDGLLKEIGALAVRGDQERSMRLDTETMRSIEALVVDVERMRGEAASPHKIERFAEELAVLSAKLETAGPSSSATFDALAARLDDVRAELAQFPRVGAVEELAADIQALVARLDGQERASAERAAEAKLAEAAIRAEFANQSSAVAIDGVSRKLDALAEQLESQNTASSVHALPGKVDALTGKLDALAAATLTRQADVERVADVVRAELAAFTRPDGGIADIGEKIEALTLQLSLRPKSMAGFEELSAKVDGLGERLGSTQAQGAAFDRIEEAVRGIAEHLVVTSSAPASATGGLEGVESRIARLVDSLERTDGRIDDLNAGFASLASRIEQSCAGLGAEAGRAAASAVRESFVEQVSSEGVSPTDLAEALGEIRSAASRNDRRTADTLDAVRMTLERLVDRMEILAQPGERPATAFVERLSVDERPMTAAVPVIDATEAARAAHRKALSELEGDDETTLVAPRRAQQPSFVLEPDGALDFPLEPGAGPRSWFSGDAEAAPPQSAAALIAQARRANILPAAEPEEASPLEAKESRFSPLLATLKERRRPLLLALVAALIVIGVVKFASGLNQQPVEMAPEPAPQTDMRSAPEPATPSARAAPAAPQADVTAPRSEAPPSPPPAAQEAPPAAAPPPAPKPGAMLTPPRAPAADMTNFAFAQSLGSPTQKFTAPGANEDLTTGSIARTSDALPDAIGGSMLRMRAVQGDPSAQLEIADRLAEGRGVPSDPAAAARWLEKAAAQGLAPAQHRLGSLYEKGRGVPRDIMVARRWYEQAAASGNVRAMHNLGVIHAEGGLGKPDFNAAIVWFRMAAERGLVDSQYNLAVLEARGLGGKRDLADAYKWFALADAQGDQDAGRKRDEVAKTLGAALPAAKQAVANFRPRMIESSANEAPTPAGGWDQASVRADPKAPITLR